MRTRQRSGAPTRLLTVAQAAEHLKVTPRTIRRMVARGQLTGYRLGRLIRIDAGEVDRLLVEIPSATARRWDA